MSGAAGQLQAAYLAQDTEVQLVQSSSREHKGLNRMTPGAAAARTHLSCICSWFSLVSP